MRGLVKKHTSFQESLVRRGQSDLGQPTGFLGASQTLNCSTEVSHQKLETSVSCRRAVYTVECFTATQCLYQHQQLFSMGAAAQHLGGCITTRASLSWVPTPAYPRMPQRACSWRRTQKLPRTTLCRSWYSLVAAGQSGSHG